MKKFLVLLILIALFLPYQANAQGVFGIIRAYQSGVEARQQEDYRDERLLLMQEEKTRIKAEREYLESLKKQIDQQVGSQESAEQKGKNNKAALLAAFNKNVKPRILRVHPDFDEIMKRKTYWEWAELQEPELRRCALDSPDAADIIHAISEYKKVNVTLVPVSK